MLPPPEDGVVERQPAFAQQKLRASRPNSNFGEKVFAAGFFGRQPNAAALLPAQVSFTGQPQRCRAFA